MAPYFQELQGLASEFGVPDACVPAGVARHLYPEGAGSNREGAQALGRARGKPGTHCGL